ncbi:MAG: cupin domain-containing protein [Clostridia bacterium]|nr:cupin domain-containing protein [Clostridia bacterium]
MDKQRILIHGEDVCLTDHPHVSKNTGNLTYELPFLNDPDTGMMVKLICYPKGSVTPLHDHNCAHGIYVLRGTLHTDSGDFGPGSFVWFPEGDRMIHGGLEEDVEGLFITNKAFDIHYYKK